ncbi:Beta-taxilin Muscle-derived protein 77 [Larimichthys crocea]|uniref:Beta-taxilin Muscle-derived protein 77 n=1 Tax=Larimichthys crocea TaxID=215358 RepID=A0A6G0I572_LARCR|nr:Beta-taxilin Muscle-derived protein 77 [Larimichthys crocea]
MDAESEAPPAACAASSDFFDPMEEFSRRLEDIISTYGSAASVMDRQSVVDAEMEKMKTETKEDIAAAMETEVSLVMQSLNKLSSPEEKLEDLVRRYAEVAALRRCDDRKLCVLQQRLSVLLDERQQLQADSRSSVAARSKLENLCKELQRHYDVLREETLRRCREDEEKRKEMTGHFQMMLTEIQAQIEQHSVRNDKLCHENTNLTDKLESLMGQCELREENLEKINKRRDLQQKLTEAKLQQANALLSEAEEKHKREKEYLLREAIDKTKKCCAMKEQELAMKKKLLVQAAEWKLQAQTYREQGTVMQAQLTLYAQKFDEFQETLSKSNEIYVRFKKEMDNMSDKMKKMEKESNLWKTRFENCNKALNDMIEERNEKGKEYELFVLKIQKLERLCRALQEERVVLYNKIKEVRQANLNVATIVSASSKPDDVPEAEGEDKSALLMELQEIEKEDPILTKDMSRLREEQAKLQEFAASLLATPSYNDDDEGGNDELEPEEDAMASAFSQFQTKTKVKEEAVSVPEQVVEVKSEVPEPVLPQPDTAEEVQKPAVSPPEPPTPAEKTSEITPADAKPEAVEVQTQEEDKEVQPVQSDEATQQQPAEPLPESEPEKVNVNPPTDLKPEAAEAEPLVEAAEVKPVIPEEEQKDQAEAGQAPEEEPEKKQTPKKKKKRNVKNVS